MVTLLKLDVVALERTRFYSWLSDDGSKTCPPPFMGNEFAVTALRTDATASMI
jgi:hypothetical protein